MTKTALNPKVQSVPTHETAPKATAPKKAVDERNTSTFNSSGKDAWKAMTESSETPSVIGEMLGTVDDSETTEPTSRDIEQAWLGDLMCGDYGNVRTSDNRNLKIADHEEIKIPNVQELFVKHPSLQENTFPVLERLTALQKTIADLITVNTELLAHGGISQSETEGAKDYIEYLKECMQQIDKELAVVDYYRQNELAQRKAAAEEAEKPSLTEEQIEAIEEANQEYEDFMSDGMDDMKESWEDFLDKYT